MGRLLVLENSGEVLTEMKAGDMIVRKRSVEYLESVKVWKIDHFYKGNLREIAKWMKELSPHEKALLFTVSPYVGYEDCCLKKENGDMFRFKDMVEQSCMSRATVAKSLGGLIAKDILYLGKNSKGRQYFMNPWLFSRGHRINNILKTMFSNYRIKVCQNVKWGSLKD